MPEPQQRVVEASWRRVRARGLDHGGPPTLAPLRLAELEERRERSRLGTLVPRLRSALAPAVGTGDQLMVVADADGRVLWQAGEAGVRRLADRLGFVSGSAWTEGNVGTNAIGTALVEDRPVMIRGREHYVESHTRWCCAAAPVRDPWNGQALGVVDLSGPVTRGMPGTALALVQLAARVAELEVQQAHVARLERLRAVAAPVVARVGGRALAVDLDGHVAAATGLSAPDRVALPEGLAGGRAVLVGLGTAAVEPLPGGWLLRFGGAEEHQPPTDAELDLRGSAPRLHVRGASGSWSHPLTPRHAEILLALATRRAGRTAGELAEDLFADSSRTVTVRAEMSRLRRVLGPVLCGRPYRVAPQVRLTVALPEDRATLLPGSNAPVVSALRRVSPPAG